MRWSIFTQLWLFTVIGAALGVGCGEVGPTPTVTIVEVTPEALDTGDDTADDLRIVVEYTDGDGDLGEGWAEVHDCRAPDVVTYLDIPAIASEEAVAAGVPIEGNLSLQVNDIGALPAGAGSAVCEELGVGELDPDTVVFCVILVDAAGNESVGDCTDAIPVSPGG